MRHVIMTHDHVSHLWRWVYVIVAVLSRGLTA
jgi:hypothetical protein